MVVKELIIKIGDTKLRVAWSAVGGWLEHHNASKQFFSEGDGTRVVWIADLLPNELARAIGWMTEQDLSAMTKALNR